MRLTDYAAVFKRENLIHCTTDWVGSTYRVDTTAWVGTATVIITRECVDFDVPDSEILSVSWEGEAIHHTVLISLDCNTGSMRRMKRCAIILMSYISTSNIYAINLFYNN